MENVKKILAFLLGGYAAVVAATANGRKIIWTDIFSLGPVLMLLPDALNNIQAAGTEWENADDSARAELAKYVRETLKMDDTALEAKIEAGISILVRAGGMVADVKALLGKSDVAPSTAPVVGSDVQAQGLIAEPKAIDEAPVKAPAQGKKV